MIERVECLVEAHVQHVAHLKAITAQHNQGMKQMFTSKMADIRAHTKAPVMQMGKMVRTFSRKHTTASPYNSAFGCRCPSPSTGQNWTGFCMEWEAC
jgi:hypothetical protein